MTTPPNPTYTAHPSSIVYGNTVLDSRIGPASKRSTHPKTSDPFKLWFNSASSIASTANKKHMEKLEEKLKAAELAHPTQVSSFFLTKSSFKIDL